MAHQPEKVMLTNMCMIYDNQGNILVQNRKKSWCGVAFPGGHVEPSESIVDSTIREIKEETGLSISNLNLCGIKQYQNGEVRNLVFLFKTNVFSGTLQSNDEGENFWINLKEIHSYRLAENFDFMLKVFLEDNLSEHYLQPINESYTNILK